MLVITQKARLAVLQSQNLLKQRFLSVSTKKKTKQVRVRWTNFQKYKCIDKTNLCSECWQMMYPWDSSKALSAPSIKNPYICIGCKRLLGPFLGNTLAVAMIKLKLLESNKNNGYVNSENEKHIAHHWMSSSIFNSKQSVLPAPKPDHEIAECLFKQMVKRHKQVSSTETSSAEEILELMRQSKGICTASCVLGIWLPGAPWHPFQLTIDHKVPLSRGGSSHISNLQVMLRCLNQVKSNETDAELCRWLQGFRISARVQ
ncbi:unnamed protein product [Rhizopus stolonifer]